MGAAGRCRSVRGTARGIALRPWLIAGAGVPPQASVTVPSARAMAQAAVTRPMWL